MQGKQRTFAALFR